MPLYPLDWSRWKTILEYLVQLNQVICVVNCHSLRLTRHTQKAYIITRREITCVLCRSLSSASFSSSSLLSLGIQLFTEAFISVGYPLNLLLLSFRCNTYINVVQQGIITTCNRGVRATDCLRIAYTLHFVRFSFDFAICD